MGNNYSRIMPKANGVECRSSNRMDPFSLRVLPRKGGGMFGEEHFHEMLMRERRRAERSRDPFVLMLLDAGSSGSSNGLMDSVMTTLLKSIRETDLIGWYEKGTILGIIFTEISREYRDKITDILRSKVLDALGVGLNRELISNLAITIHLFPEGQDGNGVRSVPDIRLYPEFSGNVAKRSAEQAFKRVIDVAGSLALLLLLSPALAAIALAIRFTSKGPAIFRQERLGQFGRSFKLLKFRTMFVDNDCQAHREYVQRYIAGQEVSNLAAANEPAIFKMRDDPRVTLVGRFLRKTSLDELPQFWNVLIGEMSLVGPRPPLSYEFERYDIWHRRRVLEVKPGVTGLWQVSGRSRTRFDDMVRLDLRYLQSWSLWLDLKILAATPRAVFTGDGAY